jgi:hypothetical protein
LKTSPSQIDQILLPQQTQQRENGERMAFVGCALMLAGLAVGCVKRHWAAAVPAVIGSGLLLKGGWSYHHWTRDAQQKLGAMSGFDDDQWNAAMRVEAQNNRWAPCHALAQLRWPLPVERVENEIAWTQQLLDQNMAVAKEHWEHLALGINVALGGRRGLLEHLARWRPTTGQQTIGLQLWRYLCDQAASTNPEAEKRHLEALLQDRPIWEADLPAKREMLQYLQQTHLPKPAFIPGTPSVDGLQGRVYGLMMTVAQ